MDTSDFRFQLKNGSHKNECLTPVVIFFISQPITIPDCQFVKWDKEISRFIWKGKNPPAGERKGRTGTTKFEKLLLSSTHKIYNWLVLNTISLKVETN